jgi:iron complex outermembrane recepter protein
MRIRIEDRLGQWVSLGLLLQTAALPTLVHAQENAPAAAGAQGAGQASKQESDLVLQEIIVTGVRGSITRALQAKEESVGVVDVITAEDIGKFSDNNVSEALQRIPGVTIDRSELGEGSQINLRGLGPAFSRTEINGGSAFNGFDFSVLASELFSRITIEKSPTAASTEGGLAGTVYQETPKPFDFTGLTATATMGGSIGQEGDTVPRGFALISKNWDDRYGLSASIAYSETDFRTNQLSFGSWGPFRQVASPTALATAPAALLDAAIPRTTAYYSYIQQRKNIGGTLAFQARPTDEFDLTADFIYAHSDGKRWDDRPDAPLEVDVAAPTSYTIRDGAVTSGTFPGVQNRIGTSYRPSDDEVYQFSLRGDWRPNEVWTISPGLTYAHNTVEDKLELFSFAINNTDFSYSTAGDFPDFGSNRTDFSSNPADYGLNVFFYDRNKVEEKEVLAKLDFERAFDTPGFTALKFGMRFTDRTSDADGGFSVLVQGSSALLPGAPTSMGPVARWRDFAVDGAPGRTPSRILAADVDRVKALFYGNADPYSAPGFIRDPNDTALRTFSIDEQTLAGYLMGEFEFGDVKMNAGVRLVRTESSSSGSQLIDGEVSPRSDSNSYTNYLPALNVRYALRPDMLVRATYSRTVNRPALFDLRPSAIIDSGPRTGSRGNPDLLPYTADQADLGIEYYFHSGALLNVTGFVKEIDSLITQTTVQEMATFPDQLTRQPIQGLIAFTQPANGNSASVRGVEMGLQSPFYFLPGAFSNFGGIINYTYADSEASITDATGSRSTALPGLSKNSINAVLYYDNGRFDTRLAYAWRDTYLRDDPVGRQFGAERFIKSFGQLDLAVNFRLFDHLLINIQALNLLDEQRLEVTRVPGIPDLPTNVLELERRVLFGARFTF